VVARDGACGRGANSYGDIRIDDLVLGTLGVLAVEAAGDCTTTLTDAMKTAQHRRLHCSPVFA